MAFLSWLNIHFLRNIKQATLDLHPRFNILCGANGSGKTTILEAIYCLSQVRSFRSSQTSILVQYHQPQLTIAGALNEDDRPPITLGITKTQTGETILQEGGVQTRSQIARAKRLPVQLLTPDSFKLWLEGPSQRRAFLDWGVFHVEPSYGALWQVYQRALKQRNLLLKQNASIAELLPWEETLSQSAQQLTQQRQTYLKWFLNYWQQVWGQFYQKATLSLSLDPGWDLAAGSLKEVFAKIRHREQRLGYTLVGPHRADLLCQMYGLPAAQLLSRGQLKLLICALFIAQAQVLEAITQQKSILLCDDLACELDAESRGQVLRAFEQLPNQMILTAIEPEVLKQYLPSKQLKMFHVEHGCLEEVASTSIEN